MIESNEILKETVEVIEQQSEKGLKKYGTLVNPHDYSLQGWLTHTQQELADALVYTTTIKKKISMIEKELQQRIAFFEALGDNTSKLRIIELEWALRLMQEGRK